VLHVTPDDYLNFELDAITTPPSNIRGCVLLTYT